VSQEHSFGKARPTRKARRPKYEEMWELGHFATLWVRPMEAACWLLYVQCGVVVVDVRAEDGFCYGTV
jgi:hypothetical protein